MYRMNINTKLAIITIAAGGIAAFVLPDTAEAARASKVDVCHIPPANPSDFHTITISENALAAHLAHGDLEGPCSAFCDFLCGDGDACTVDYLGDCEEDGCLPEGERPPTDCNDSIACTVDSCDSSTGCIKTPDDAFCDDGQFCNGDEFCSGTFDCQAGTPPDLYDGIDCTDDSCDELNDVVIHAPNDANCDNLQFCDGVEFCSATLDCQAGTPPDLNDGIDCTDDSCDEVNDVVLHAPDDANCDNLQFCDGELLREMKCATMATFLPVTHALRAVQKRGMSLPVAAIATTDALNQHRLRLSQTSMAQAPRIGQGTRLSSLTAPSRTI
jgi:hypothetical protein